MAKKAKKNNPVDPIENSGFELYAKHTRVRNYSASPSVTIGFTGNLFFNKASVEEFNLKDFNFISYYFNKSKKQIGFKLSQNRNGKHERKLSTVRKEGGLFTFTKSFIRDMKIRRGQPGIPLSICEETGLLVATVELES